MPEKEPDDVLELRVGEHRALRLPGLATAGYRWSAEGSEEDLVEVAPGATERGSGEAALGASEDEVFTVRALKPGVSKIRFSQRRPFDPDGPAAAEHVVELHIED